MYLKDGYPNQKQLPTTQKLLRISSTAKAKIHSPKMQSPIIKCCTMSEGWDNPSMCLPVANCAALPMASYAPPFFKASNVARFHSWLCGPLANYVALQQVMWPSHNKLFGPFLQQVTQPLGLPIVIDV